MGADDDAKFFEQFKPAPEATKFVDPATGDPADRVIVRPSNPPIRPFDDPDAAFFDQFKVEDDPHKATANAAYHGASNTPKKPNLSWTDVPGAFAKNSYQDAVDFFKAVRNAYQHPKESLDALRSGIGKAPEVLRNAAGGVALNTLTPDVRQMIVDGDPTLQKMSNTGDTIANAPKAVHDYVAGNYGTWQDARNSLGYHPIRTLADASTVLTAPLGGASLVGTGARLAGRAAAAGSMFGEAMDATAQGANAIARATSLPARLGDTINPIAFIPDMPGNALVGAGAVTRGLGAERIGNFISATGNAIKPTEAVNNLTSAWARHAMAPESRVFLDATGNEAQAVADALEARNTAPAGTVARAGDRVPGSTPTGPEAVAHIVNAPKLQVLGEEAKKNQVELAKALDDRRKAARVAHVEDQVSGTPQQRAQAVQDQRTDRALNYGAADATTFTIDGALMDVLNTPEGQTAIAQINTNRLNRGLPPLGTAGHLRVGDPMDGVTVHEFKKQLDDAQFKASGAAKPDSDNIRAIGDTQRRFLELVDRPGFNPMYNLSRRVDAGHYRGIDQNNTGAFMESLANDPAAWEAARTNPSNLNTRNPSINKATGHSRYDHHEDYMAPEHLAAFDDISADHARSAEAAAQAKLATEYRGDLDNAFEPMTAPHVMGLKGRVAAALLNHAIGDINPEVAANVSRALMSPEGTLDLANNALAQQAHIGRRTHQVNALAQFVKNMLIRNPTMYNVLDDRRNALAEMMNQRLSDNGKP